MYCSSMDVIETVASPTFFCKIQGWSLKHILVNSLIHYAHVCCIYYSFAFVTSYAGTVRSTGLVLVVFGVVLHIGFIFYATLFPITAMRTKRYMKWVHLCIVCSGTHIALVLYVYLHAYVHTYCRLGNNCREKILAI